MKWCISDSFPHLLPPFWISVCVCVLVPHLCPTLADPVDVAHQAALSKEFSGQEYWSGLPFSSPGELPDPGIKPGSSALQTDSWPSEPPEIIGLF